jgi:imidazolonepropionase-like amidohydrolase
MSLTCYCAALIACCSTFSALTQVTQGGSISAGMQPYVKVNARKVVLTHVRVLDGTGAPAADDRNVVIENGKITAISAGADAASDTNTTVLDLRGHTVLPGIVGMHNHLFYIARPNLNVEGKFERPASIPEMAFTSPRLYLAAGVTTMRTTGSVEPYADLGLKHEIDGGKVVGPHIDVTGPYLDGVGTIFYQMHPLASPEEARRFVDFWVDQGVTSFKAYTSITRAELKAAVEEAHKHGIKVTGHLCSVTYREAADAGIDNLEHGFFVNTELDPDKKPDACTATQGFYTLEHMDPNGPQAADLIRYLIAHHVAITSTLPVFEQDNPLHVVLRPQMLATMTPEAREAYLYARNSKQGVPHDAAILHLKNDMQMERNFVAAGGLLLGGPDPTGNGGVLPGFGDQREIELLVEAGFSPAEAVRIATLNGAIYLGRDKQIGSIATGKNADLVIVLGNPAEKITDIENVELVFKDGVGYDSQKLFDSVKGRYGQY